MLKIQLHAAVSDLHPEIALFCRTVNVFDNKSQDKVKINVIQFIVFIHFFLASMSNARNIIRICNSIDKIFQSQTTIKTKNNRVLNTRNGTSMLSSIPFYCLLSPSVSPPLPLFPFTYAWYDHKSLMAEHLNGNDKNATIMWCMWRKWFLERPFILS